MELLLTAGTIRALAHNSAVTKEFPFLLPYGRKRAAACCGGAASYPDAAGAVAAIMRLPPARKARFKVLTGAGTVSGEIVRAARVVSESF